jgi:GNAT superfamily N-acetyltransferase
MDPALPPGSQLIAAMVAEMNELYGNIEADGLPTATPADFAPPAGTFLVGYHEGEPVCAGGIKRIAPDAAEIKRMYVLPAARRRGVARTLLGALEGAARERGYAFVRLDTGPLQRGAIALYASAGYTEIGNFNANPIASYWGEKRLYESAAHSCSEPSCRAA